MKWQMTFTEEAFHIENGLGACTQCGATRIWLPLGKKSSVKCERCRQFTVRHPHSPEFEQHFHVMAEGADAPYEETNND